jgi:hypothetical protein
MVVSLPAAWVTMHVAWGTAFWWGFLEGFGGRDRT